MQYIIDKKQFVKISNTQIHTLNMSIPYYLSATAPPPRNGLAIRPKFKAAIDVWLFCDRACSSRSRTA